MVLADGLSNSFRHLEGSDQIKTRIEEPFDTFITVDCADFKRTGKPFKSLAQPDINIDHHITNERFGKLNLIEGKEVATCAILTNHLPAWGYEITRPIAAALLTGIVTDTLGLPHLQCNAGSHAPDGDLMETGADMPDLYMRGLVSRSLRRGTLLGCGPVEAGAQGRYSLRYPDSCGPQKRRLLGERRC